MSRPYQRAANVVVPPGLSLHYARVDAPGEDPEPEPGLLDVAVLDMHHGYPNLGHASIVETVLNLAHLERQEREGIVPGVRVISYDVRGRGAVPRGPAARFRLVVGSGGPGAIDPHENDGVSPGSQGIHEDPSWLAPLFRFFDDVHETPSTSFLGICHSFGLLATWSGVAVPVFRTELKGGKSHGVVGNELTGVSPTINATADCSVEIPMYGVKQSINAAVAYGIALFDFARFLKAGGGR
jgi:hypothetical protein